MANELKAVLESPYELVVENHIVLFGGRDATGAAYGKNKDGSYGEYFTKSTILNSEYTDSGVLHVDFEHGQDPDEIGNEKNNILGIVDWKTAKIDDEGVIVRRVLNRRHKYMTWLEPLIKAGLVGNSSEAIGGSTEKSESGEIKKWPLRRDTITVNPMEPRMLDKNALAALKSLADEFPQYKSLITPDAALPDKDDKTNSIKMEKNTMDTNEEIKNLVAAGIAEAMKAKADADKAQADRESEIKAAKAEAYKQALEDVRENKAPAFNTKTVLGFSEEKDAVPAFKHWVQTGQVNGGLIAPDSSFNIKDAKAAWNVTTGASGGYLVPDPLYNQIIAKRDLASWVRQLPVQSFQTAADHLLVPREDTSNTAFVLTAEAGAYDEDEATVSQKDLILYKYTKLNKVSEEFLMYNATNFESWFSDSMARAVAATENTAFTTGSGSGAPEGIVTGATVANTTATTDVILPAELTSLFGYLGNGYNVPSECGILMNNATKWYLAGQTGNPFLFQSTPAGSPDNLLGYKVVVDDDVVTYTTASSKCIVFGNMNYYGIVEKPGMLVQRNPYLYMANGQVGIFASIFRGGGVLQSEAFYYLTNHS